MPGTIVADVAQADGAGVVAWIAARGVAGRSEQSSAWRLSYPRASPAQTVFERSRPGTSASSRHGGASMPPAGVKPGSKRARQYEHIKESLKDEGRSERPRRGDRGAHRQQGARAARRVEDRVEGLDEGHALLGRARWTALGHEAREGTDARPALRRGAGQEREGPLEDEQGAARARGRSVAVAFAPPVDPGRRRSS